MAKLKKIGSSVPDTGNVIGHTQFAQFRAEQATPVISKREVDKIFDSPDVRFELAVQRDIAAFGSMIRNLRRDAYLTQAELAKKSGVSRATIANLEAGCLEGGPRLGTLATLARSCGVQLRPFISPVSEPSPEKKP